MIYSPSAQEISTWATAIATIIILVRQQTSLNNSNDAKQHAKDAAMVSVQTYHLVNGQMTAQLKRFATLANKVAQLTPNDNEAQVVATEANDAVIEKDKTDAKILATSVIEPIGAINRLSESDTNRKDSL